MANIDLTQVAVALIGLVTVIISSVVYPLLKAKLSSAQIENLEAWAHIGVKAAEQIYIGSGRGEEKKADVLNFIANQGIKIDVEVIDRAIEAAVLDLKKAKAADSAK